VSRLTGRDARSRRQPHQPRVQPKGLRFGIGKSEEHGQPVLRVLAPGESFEGLLVIATMFGTADTKAEAYRIRPTL
jgi:hypothetical protein